MDGRTESAHDSSRLAPLIIALMQAHVERRFHVAKATKEEGTPMFVQKYVWVCVDCLFVLVSRKEFDLARGPKAFPYRIGSRVRVVEVEEAVAMFDDVLPDFVDGGDGRYIASRAPCECCQSAMTGDRWRFVVLAQDAESVRPHAISGVHLRAPVAPQVSNSPPPPHSVAVQPFSKPPIPREDPSRSFIDGEWIELRSLHK